MLNIVKIKNTIANAFDFFGIIDKRIINKSKSSYLILMYHRIFQNTGFCKSFQAGMYVEPETFEMHIRYLKQHFDVVSLSEMFSSVHDKERSRSAGPVCALTFDDGWQDFFKFAFPVLMRNQVPATVFLPTGYIGTNDWFWTDRLGRIMATDIQRVKPGGRGFPLDNSLMERITHLHGPFEKKLETAISILKEREEKEIEEVIAELQERSGIRAASLERIFLNWEEVREMRSSGWVSYGSHTHHHRILIHLKEEEVRRELGLSKQILLREGVVDFTFIPFCYPNGASNQRIAGMVREAGYHLAVSTGTGWNEKNASPFALKRVPIHQDMTASREMFGCRVAEIL
jgi:peptidoglycan/xylan/chitin deacetylase (PgdA/CDA1 family)